MKIIGAVLEEIGSPRPYASSAPISISEVDLDPPDAGEVLVAIESAGHPRAFETAVDLTAPGGTTITVGLPAPTAESVIKPLGLTAEARTIMGSYLGSAVPSRDIPRFAELWRHGWLPVQELISGRVPLAGINVALDNLASGTAIRQMITFG